MARDYGRIRSQFWADERVRAWSLDLKAVAAYLLTCEHATALGAFRVPPAYIADDLGITPAEARGHLKRMEADGFIRVCNSGWVWIIKYLRHNRPENANVRKHIFGLARAVPSVVSFRADLMASLAADLEGDAPEKPQKIEVVPKPFRNPSKTLSNTEPNLTYPNLSEPNLSEPVSDSEIHPATAVGARGAPKTAKATRIPPDWEPDDELTAFAAGLGFDPDRIATIAATFRDYWIAKSGAGGRKFDWAATWRNWCRREAEGKLNDGTSGQRGQSRGQAARAVQLAAALGSIGRGSGG